MTSDVFRKTSLDFTAERTSHNGDAVSLRADWSVGGDFIALISNLDHNQLWSRLDLQQGFTPGRSEPCLQY